MMNLKSIGGVVLRWMGVTVDPGNRKQMESLLGGTWAGKRVTVDGALSVGVIWRCVRLISESIATLPLGFYRRRPDGSRKLATDHELYDILHSQPNANMAAVTFWEVVVLAMLLWGNAYVRIQRVGGRIAALDFLSPEQVKVTRADDGLLDYEYTTRAGQAVKIARGDMMHIPAFTLDGLTGLSVVAYSAQTIATTMATDEASAKAFSSGMRASGAISTKEVLKPQQREDLRASLQGFRGNQDAGAIMVLEAGSTFEKLSMNPDDMQLLESRAWNVEELCRWFAVPPFMVGHSEKSTTWGTGIEQQMIGFVTFVLRPWCVRIEQAIRRSLLADGERGRYFAEFSLEGLMRGDSASRAAFYSVMVNNGILTRDEVRALENWPAMGGNAEVLTVQSAMVPLDDIAGASASDNVQTALKNWLAEKS